MHVTFPINYFESVYHAWYISNTLFLECIPCMVYSQYIMFRVYIMHVTFPIHYFESVYRACYISNTLF